MMKKINVTVHVNEINNGGIEELRSRIVAWECNCFNGVDFGLWYFSIFGKWSEEIHGLKHE
jgi:hypothetical protein